ncbi:MAG: thiamine pyrophosphate-dependent enzyme [Patescibacteria group bacterium]|nr:thiamine pyrophosphate-dependent enzyme [Patescibacteria group bacterium]
MLQKYKKPTLFYPGHNACSGCGQNLTARHVINTLGPNTIVVGATGCLEVTTTKFGESAWGVPYIHSLFENSAAVATGILAGLSFKNKNLGATLSKVSRYDQREYPQVGPRASLPNVVVLAGDGATFDIGFGLLAGMFERGDNILYVCFDNEGYQNTGAQASGSSTLGADTTTTPSGKDSTGDDKMKKNMIAFAVSQGVPYVATSTAAYPKDVEEKIKKALEFQGPKYIQILVPCIPGWGIETNKTVEVARLAATTGFYPVLEIINGVVTKVLKTPDQKPKIEEYLKLQDRYKHLFKSEEGKAVIKRLQKICDANVEVYGLCPTCEEHEILMQYKL